MRDRISFWDYFLHLGDLLFYSLFGEVLRLSALQLVAVQHRRGASGGLVFANALELRKLHMLWQSLAPPFFGGLYTLALLNFWIYKDKL